MLLNAMMCVCACGPLAIVALGQATYYSQPRYDAFGQVSPSTMAPVPTTSVTQSVSQPASSFVPRYDTVSIDTARRSADRFRDLAHSLPVSVAEIARENADFADRWAGLAENMGTLTERVNDANHKLQATTRDFTDVSAKIEDYGLTPTIGLLLRNKQEQLDQWQAHDSQTLFASQEIGRSRQEQLELEMVRLDGSDIVAQTDELLTQPGVNPSGLTNSIIARQISDLLRQRHGWLEALRQGYHDYQQKLGELDAAMTASTKLSDDYRRLIDRHVMWIRSGDPVSVSDLGRIKPGLAAFFSTRRSGEFGLALENKWNANPATAIGLLTALLLITIVRWRAKVLLLAIGERKRMRASTPAVRQVLASFLTVVVSSGIPLMLYGIARWLDSGVVSESTLHAASGCYAASLVAWMVEVPRQVLRKFGYVDQFVNTDMPRRDRATAYLTLIGFGLVLAAYVVTFSGLFDRGIWRDSVSRFGFIGSMCLVAWTVHLSLRPNGGFLEPLIAKLGGSVIHRVRVVMYLIGIGFPFAMIAASALGYGDTASEFIKRTIFTLVGLTLAATLWGGIKILSAMAWQALVGSDKNAAKQDGVRSTRRYGEAEVNSEVTGVLGEHYLELKHQLAFLCQCALVLAGIVGFGWLWIDMFPHVRMGNPVVWTVQDALPTSDFGADGQRVVGSMIQETPITAMHLALAAATLFVAFQLAKLLPALFDALVLQRVSFDEGMEHFSLVLGRCLLFGVGCLVACQWIGVRWQTIQWLAVGLTIGLGFGLQDMVRNLFGGLIVLFEKPARLGDFITVGRVTGRVAAQRLRTTVLSDDEGREVIIPNKNFVNEDVTNWMGAGRLNVIPIEVAVSRDRRPADICRKLQELVIDQDVVLLSPAPHATLVCVGKRTQRIEVRAWIEPGPHPERYRDELLKVVRRFLHDQNILAADQPTQPDMDEVSRKGVSRRLKRSA